MMLMAVGGEWRDLLLVLVAALEADGASADETLFLIPISNFKSQRQAVGDKTMISSSLLFPRLQDNKRPHQLIGFREILKGSKGLSLVFRFCGAQAIWLRHATQLLRRLLRPRLGVRDNVRLPC